MQQSVTIRLHQYWNTLRIDGRSPSRKDIAPRAIADILPHLFILEFTGRYRWNFRLAGTQVCDQLGRELKGEGIAGFFDKSDENLAIRSITRAAIESTPLCITVKLHMHLGDRAAAEILLLPLSKTPEERDQLLGSFALIHESHNPQLDTADYMTIEATHFGDVSHRSTSDTQNADNAA